MKRARRIGLMLWPVPALDAGFERGRWAERAGYDDVWLADAQGLHDPLALAAALGAVTTRIRLCTGVVPVFNRPPAVLATAVSAVAERAPGRCVLGLGASTANMVDRWYGLDYAKPLTRVRETVVLLRRILAGERTDFHGEVLRSQGFRLAAPPTTPVPLFVGAIGMKMLQLAGELADGVVLNDFTPPDRLAWALTQIDVGARRAGRTVADLEIVRRRAVLVTRSIDEDTAALADCREQLAFYASAAAYQAIMSELGYAHAVAEARAGYATRDRARVSAAITDDMVQRIFPFGPAARWQALLRADYAAGIDTVIVSPQARTAEAFAHMAETFAVTATD